jgi:hypothetical protein
VVVYGKGELTGGAVFVMEQTSRAGLVYTNVLVFGRQNTYTKMLTILDIYSDSSRLQHKT